MKVHPGGVILSYANHDRRVGVIGSHGAVGRMVVDRLRRSGCEVVCGNRTRTSTYEDSSYVDAYREDSVREFARGCDAIVNCAGPSCLIGDRVAAALTSDAVYLDPFGGNAFEPDAGKSPRVVNVGCTPGLSGLLARHLAQRFERCDSATVCCGGREQGGVAGFADVILSTRDGYGHPNRMLVGGRALPYAESPWESRDTDAFPRGEEIPRSPFVTEELRRVAEAYGIPRLTGLLVVPDRESLHLLLKAMTHSDTDDRDELMGLFARIDRAKAELDAGKENWFAMQVSARGRTGRELRRTSVALRARDSSELTAIVLAAAVLRVLEEGCPPGVHWGYEFLEPRDVLDAIRRAGVRVRDSGLVEEEAHPCGQDAESGFL